MADAYVDKVAGELADLALADENHSGDEKIVNEIGEILGSSSQTLQEAYLTAVRVRRAEARARLLLSERARDHVVDKNRMIEDRSKEPAPRERGTVFERERTPDGTAKPAAAPNPPADKAGKDNDPDMSFEDSLARNIEDLADFAAGKKKSPEQPSTPDVKPSRPQRR